MSTNREENEIESHDNQEGKEAEGYSTSVYWGPKSESRINDNRSTEEEKYYTNSQKDRTRQNQKEETNVSHMMICEVD